MYNKDVKTNKEEFSETSLRKNMPMGIGEAKKIKSEIEGIYDKKELDFNNIKNNPVLKPISEINNSYINFELLINRALWDYESDKKQIDDMIVLNPKYSETIILSKFQSILSYIKQIIHAQDLQKENMKNAIEEMVRIVKQEYALLQEEEEGFPRETIKTKEKKQEEEIKDINENEKIKSEDKEIEKEEPERGFYSELLEKKVPAPENKSKKGEFITLS